MKKTSSGLHLAVVAAGAIASVPAAAGPVAISQTVTLNTLIQSSAGSTLSFDLSGFLSSQGYAASEVVGGQVSVFGFSEASYGPAANDPYSGYNVQTVNSGSHTGWYSYYVQGYSSCSWWGGCYYYGGYYAWAPYTIYDYQQTSDRDVRHVDAVADQMQVTAGTTSATATASTQLSSATGFGSYLYDGREYTNCYNGNCSYTDKYHRERDVYSAVYGALDTTLALDAAALIDLRGDGQLSLGLAAPVGQFSVSAVSFDLVVQHAQSLMHNNLSAAQVPEPSGLPLTAVALASALAAGMLVRRRRQAP